MFFVCIRAGQAGLVWTGDHTVEVKLNDGEGHDTYASSYKGAWTDVNKGNSESVWFGKAGDWRHVSYFRFDELSTAGLPSERIRSARLWLCIGRLEQPSSAAEVVVLTHEVLETWTERSVGGLTGVSQPACAADYASRTPEIPSVGWHEYDVTGLVRGWLADPASNHGVRLSQESDVDQTYYYVSSEAKGPYPPTYPLHDAEHRPYIEIAYLVSEPGTVVCLLVGAGLVRAFRRKRT
jgi:hypothetical protein